MIPTVTYFEWASQSFSWKQTTYVYAKNKNSLKILRGNQNPEIEGQKTQLTKEKEQNNKQRSAKHCTQN